jgi:hypothetical protein
MSCVPPLLYSCWISPCGHPYSFARFTTLFLDFSLFVHDCTIPWLAAAGVQYIRLCTPQRLPMNERSYVAYDVDDKQRPDDDVYQRNDA